jgi:formylglycine-generating enzyme required for sulfatase activity
LNIRKSRAAAALARLGQPEKVWRWLVFDPRSDDPASADPSLRTEVLHALAEYRVPAETLVDRLARGLPTSKHGQRDVRETSIQRALLLALGNYTRTMPLHFRQEIIERLQLQTVFECDPDPGIHGATELLLRRWGAKQWLRTSLERLSKQRGASRHNPEAPSTWFVNSQRQTFVVLSAGVFTMGSPSDEQGRVSKDEQRHQRWIDRSVAIATTEVTRWQYAEFCQATGRTPPVTPYSKTVDDPQTLVTWHDAVRYCNWLSVREGLPPCYHIDEQNPEKKVYLAPGFLDCRGYRLPTEAEWEYACRAGVPTTWSHGRAARRLGFYAWFDQNSDDRLWPVGRLLPNESGLFDTSGNALEWCQDHPGPYPRDRAGYINLLDPRKTVDSQSNRAMRGGSFTNESASVRAATRFNNIAGSNFLNVSFRPLRTWP